MTATNEQDQGAVPGPTATATQLQSEQPVDLPAYVSPTLLRLEERLRPSPSTICESCPASVWLRTQDGVECYCRVMHVKTWTSEEPKAFQACDGEVQANLERLAQLMPG